MRIKKKYIKKSIVVGMSALMIAGGLNLSSKIVYANEVSGSIEAVTENETVNIRKISKLSECTKTVISEIKKDTPKKLVNEAANMENNIFLYDESGKLISEIYPDGYIVKYQYNADSIVSVDTEGYSIVYECTDGKYIKEEVCFNNEKIEDTSELTDNFLLSSRASTTNPTVKNYVVNGKNMNKLLTNAQFTFNASSSWTQSKIQSFLNNKNSFLKNDIKVYAKNSSGSVYDTGRVITPAKVIYTNARDYKINPKVILATIQKESSLITTSSVDVKSRRLYFAMGYGATDSGDLTSYTGFDRQVSKGAKKLSELYQNAPSDKTLSVHGGKKVTINGITYPAKICLSNAATWALYKYTPHVFDPSYTSSVTGGNYLFKQICEGWGWF